MNSDLQDMIEIAKFLVEQLKEKDRQHMYLIERLKKAEDKNENDRND